MNVIQVGANSCSCLCKTIDKARMIILFSLKMAVICLTNITIHCICFIDVSLCYTSSNKTIFFITLITYLSSKVWESGSFKFLSKQCMKIRVITKLPNSKQSYKGRIKTHNYINRQNQSTTGKL